MAEFVLLDLTLQSRWCSDQMWSLDSLAVLDSLRYEYKVAGIKPPLRLGIDKRCCEQILLSDW